MVRRSNNLKDAHDSPVSSHDEHLRKEMERVNAQMRHFMGISATIINKALEIWMEISRACNDVRSVEQILEGDEQPASRLPLHGWDDLRRKLDLLGHYLDYTRRLCDGSIAAREKRGGTTDAREV